MAKLEIYDIGDMVRFSVDIEVLTVLTDPTDLKFRFMKPDKSVEDKTFPADSEVVNDAVGKFHIDKTFSISGRYRFRWEATGVAVGAAEKEFEIRKSKFSISP